MLKSKTVFTCCITIITLLCIVDSSLYAFNLDDYDTFKKTKSCAKCDLEGADLEMADLKDANLKGSDLGMANLIGASLRSARLEGAIWIDGSKCKKGSIGKCAK